MRRTQNGIRGCLLALAIFAAGTIGVSLPEAAEAGGLGCRAHGEKPCYRPGIREFCYNTYNKGTATYNYYGCYYEDEEPDCAPGLLLIDNLCQDVGADRGITCCQDVVIAGRLMGYKAEIDISKATPIVPQPDLDYCLRTGGDRYDAVRRMSGWMSQPEYDTLVATNANFFQADQVAPNPHLYMCTTVLGPAVAKGKYVAGQGNDSVDGVDLYSLAIYTLDHARDIGRYADIFKSSELPSSRYISEIVRVAVSGTLLGKDGRYSSDTQLPWTKRTETVPRTAVGIKADGKTLVLVTIQNGDKTDGLTLKALAKLMMTTYGSQIVLNLDGGGSATFYAYDYNGEKPFLSPPSDKLPGLSNLTGDRYYRPFPIFLGFR